MGGRSDSRVTMSPEQVMTFAGSLSPENNGGFASTRASLTVTPPADAKAVRLRVRGDGKVYQFRVRTDANWDGPAYRHTFQTEQAAAQNETDSAWQEITLHIDAFELSFRGRPSPMPPRSSRRESVKLAFSSPASNGGRLS